MPEKNALMASMGFDLKPCAQTVDLADTTKFSKLALTQSQRIQMNSLLGEVPSLLASQTLAQTYILQFPDGIQHSLVQLSQGGQSSTWLRPDGKIGGTASLYSATPQAACLAAFTAMSIASGQYFLSEINSKMNMMKLSLDKILEFLYGDKKAELMSEISFIRFAYQNYGSIMEYDQQRMATIISLQNSRKVAMKDIEFYLSDLASTVAAKDGMDISTSVEKSIQVKECLELSMQLYVMSDVLEVFYSQNHDPSFLSYIEEDATSYITKCEKRMLSGFSMLQQSLAGHKDKLLGKKIDKDILEKQVGSIVEALGVCDNSPIRDLLHSALKMPDQKATYYLDSSGDVYLRAS